MHAQPVAGSFGEAFDWSPMNPLVNVGKWDYLLCCAGHDAQFDSFGARGRDRECAIAIRGHVKARTRGWGRESHAAYCYKENLAVGISAR